MPKFVTLKPEYVDKPHLPPPGKKKVVTITNEYKKGQSDLVSYEDLLVAQYLEDVRRTRGEVSGERELPPSPYLQRLATTSNLSYATSLNRRRPFSASMAGHPKTGGKPKIDAKFIADTNMWDPVSPREKPKRKGRPVSAPVRRMRPFSGMSVASYASSRWSRPLSGKKVKSQYRKRAKVIRVIAYKNGSRDAFVKIAAQTMKMLLECCTEKLHLGFAARRVFLEDGVEVFEAGDIPLDAEVYVSCGENYKNPYVAMKRNYITKNGSKWTLTGIVIPEEGKKKKTRTQMSKRMRALCDTKRVRILVYKNGKSTEPVEIVADLANYQDFLIACTGKLDLRSHARLVFDWEGKEITDLSDTPVLDDCLQQGGTPVLGPLWISTGEGFSPGGTLEFLLSIKQLIQDKLKNTRKYKKEINHAMNDENDKVTIASILSMSPEDLYEADELVNNDMEELSGTLERLDKKIESIKTMSAEEENEGHGYRLSHIKHISADHRLVGTKGLRLKVFENGYAEDETIFYFNLREALRGIGHDRQKLLQRLLDDLSNSRRTSYTQGPKILPIAQKIFDEFGREITDVTKLEYDQEIWVSFCEAFINPFNGISGISLESISEGTYCVQITFDGVKGVDLGDRTALLREQLMSEDLEGKESANMWEVSSGVPTVYDYQSIENPDEKAYTLEKLTTTELDSNGSFIQFKEKDNLLLYPELVVNKKLKKGHKEVWPYEAQVLIISKLMIPQWNKHDELISVRAISYGLEVKMKMLCFGKTNWYCCRELVLDMSIYKNFKLLVSSMMQLGIQSVQSCLTEFLRGAQSDKIEFLVASCEKLAGHIYSKAFPQLCLGVSDSRVEVPMQDREQRIEAFVVTFQKKATSNLNQIWKFQSDGTVSSEAYPNLLLTHLGKKLGVDDGDDENCNLEGMKPGNKVFLVVSDRVPRKDSDCQRFALKQERLDIVGQWKYTDSSNPEFHKQALSWPVKQDGSLNEGYDWPMEGYLYINAPPIKKSDKRQGLSGTLPVRLLVMKNGERDPQTAVPIVGPNISNLLNVQSKADRKDKKKSRKEDLSIPPDAIADDDIYLHCDDLTVREMEFNMFLNQCTSMLQLPFAARRLFDENGVEHFTLQDLTRDQFVFVTCGEIWTDPTLSKAEQQRRFLLSQLYSDVQQLRQFCAMRNPEHYVLEVEGSLVANSRLTVNKVWSKEQEEEEMQRDMQSQMSKENSLMAQSDGEIDTDMLTSHERSHYNAEQRLNKLKWPWEKLMNVEVDDDDSDAQKYTDKEMYEKFKPRKINIVPRDSFQRFNYEDGYISVTSDRNLVLGVEEQEGRVNQVILVRRKPDDGSQRWTMMPNGEIRSKHNTRLVLTISMPTNNRKEDEQGRPLTFAECPVTLQAKRANAYGKAHQRWHYDAETGHIYAFHTDLPDKEITAANKADVCTFAVSGTTEIDQPGYMCEISVEKGERSYSQKISVCTSCARSMRGRYKLFQIPDGTKFSCARAMKLKLKHIGSFRVLNGKVDLSTHEALLTLEQWEETLERLRVETSIRTISREIGTAKKIKTIKVLVYKNGEGRMRTGEIVCGSSIQGILNQSTHKLGLGNAARRLYTEDGTMILEVEDLIDWAVENYKNVMVEQMDKMLGKDGDIDQDLDIEPEEPQMKNINLKMIVEESQVNLSQEEEEQTGQSQEFIPAQTTEVDQEEAKKLAQRRDYLLSQIKLPSLDTILRYPIEVWISSGKTFVQPEVVESKAINRRKKRAFRSAVSLELDIEKHVLRQMKGRRFDEQNPGEYKSTRDTKTPVVLEGNWQEPTVEEQLKHENVNRLESHLQEVRQGHKLSGSVSTLNTGITRRLYKQPSTKRILIYPNGEPLDRALHIWGSSLDELLDNASARLNLWQRARYLFTLEGRQIEDFVDIPKDEILCASATRSFIKPDRYDIEIKANWSRARKQYGPSATELQISASNNPKVNVDPFGPPELVMPPNGTQPQRPMSAKP